MSKLRFILLQSVVCLGLMISFIMPSYSAQVYLEDADATVPVTSNPNMPPIENHLWPRIMMSETQSLAGDAEQFSKYQVIATQGGVIRKIAELQKTYPDLMYFRMLNPYEFAGYNFDDEGLLCSQGNGVPFNSTTASTGNCGVYAGHWLYQAGTTTTAYINRTATTVSVNDASLFVAGEYAVIYDAPAGSFNNAEHVRVTSRSVTNKTVNISRAYKSTAQNHPNGSIIAPHALGQSSDNEPRNWLYNLGINGPKDASNKRFINYLPGWLNSNHKRTHTGELTDAVVSGFLFDSDSEFLANSKNADMNNDLVIDNGVSDFGVNWHGQGLNQFYADVRTLFPNHIIKGGTRNSDGAASLNGVQMEGFPSHTDFHSTNPSYEQFSSQLALYRYQSRRKDTGPAHSHVLIKTPSLVYPLDGSPAPTSNRAFRFALGSTLLEDGYFGSINSNTYPDIWYDEYAVDVRSGSSSYGYAIASNPSNESQVRAHTGWLGRPTGLRKRIYNDNQFAVSESLLQHGSFESSNDLAAWEEKEVSIAIDSDASDVQDGSKALHIDGHTSYQRLLYEASVKGPEASVIKGRQYTAVFSAKASKARIISAAIGGHTERFLLDTDWQRFVVSFTASSTGSFATKFNVGETDSEVWLDSIYLFEGDANIFRRDFDNGIVVVNATPDSQTISLGGVFQRIKGTQDAINNGQVISSVTLPAYDSALLIRQKSISLAGVYRLLFEEN